MPGSRHEEDVHERQQTRAAAASTQTHATHATSQHELACVLSSLRCFRRAAASPAVGVGVAGSLMCVAAGGDEASLRVGR